MKLQDIFKQFGNLDIIETRSMNEDYIEVVFLNRDFDSWYEGLKASLGAPRKPAGQEPSPSDQQLTSDTGGIWVNQTLFEKCFGSETVIAKFWPWGDDAHTTLKMALLNH